MGRVRRSRRSVQRHEPFLQVKADLLEEQRQENNWLLLSLMHNGLPQNPYRRRVAMARVREAQGDLDAALTLLDEARRVYAGDYSPNVRPVPALRARVLATQSEVGEALRWVREQGLSADDDLSFLHECGHITLARVLLSQVAADGSEAHLDGRAPGAPPCGSRGGRADGERHRDPRAAGAHPPRPR